MLLTFNHKIKFLFDENVDKRLERYLKKNGVDVLLKPKGLSNGKLAEFSKVEQRIFVTNDEDFSHFAKEDIFSVIWLRVPQRSIDVLIKEFSNLLKKIQLDEIKGKLIILQENKFEINSLKY
ncbi:hypothetical protein COU57_00970 [Candidatus Pacearchaeota archaeon CG10_big_fil_rev_8_21_14_0_10_32_14]|nr:MAG: hypothetical protein COU57_00970 [Candidatus Pacearchaeota archaeon CG10_big_fil_rev_8_21_14_0_10_32_14]